MKVKQNQGTGGIFMSVRLGKLDRSSKDPSVFGDNPQWPVLERDSDKGNHYYYQEFDELIGWVQRIFVRTMKHPAIGVQNSVRMEFLSGDQTVFVDIPIKNSWGYTRYFKRFCKLIGGVNLNNEIKIDPYYIEPKGADKGNAGINLFNVDPQGNEYKIENQYESEVLPEAIKGWDPVEQKETYDTTAADARRYEWFINDLHRMFPDFPPQEVVDYTQQNGGQTYDQRNNNGATQGYGQQNPPAGNQQYPPATQQAPPNQQYPPAGNQQYPPATQQAPPVQQRPNPSNQQYPPANQQYTPAGNQQYPPAGNQQYTPAGNQQYPPATQQAPPNQQYPPAGNQQRPRATPPRPPVNNEPIVDNEDDLPF